MLFTMAVFIQTILLIYVVHSLYHSVFLAYSTLWDYFSTLKENFKTSLSPLV